MSGSSLSLDRVGEIMVADLEFDSQLDESSRIMLNDEIKLSKYYILLLCEIILFFVFAFTTESEEFGICLLFILLHLFLAILLANTLGSEFLRGVAYPVIWAIPLSVASYFNELKNSCFCPIWCTCPEPPGYYHFPRVIAAFSLFVILISSIERQFKGEKAFGFGLFVGMLGSVMIFLYATLSGFW